MMCMMTTLVWSTVITLVIRSSGSMGINDPLIRAVGQQGTAQGWAWGHARPCDALCDPKGQITGLRRDPCLPLRRALWPSEPNRSGGASPLAGAAA